MSFFPILDKAKKEACTNELGFLKILNQELEMKQDMFQKVSILLEHFRDTHNDSKFKTAVLGNYDFLKLIYEERNVYSKNNNYFENLAEENKTIYERACKEYKKGKLNEAAANFKIILENSIQYLNTDNRDLPAAFYNYGRRLFQQNRFLEALDILKTAYDIYEAQWKCKKDSALEMSMNKIKSMISECQEKI